MDAIYEKDFEQREGELLEKLMSMLFALGRAKIAASRKEEVTDPKDLSFDCGALRNIFKSAVRPVRWETREILKKTCGSIFEDMIYYRA